MDQRLRSHSNLLSRLMQSELAPPEWARREFGDILKHQLAAPLIFDLGSVLGNQIDGALELERREIRNFGDLLRHPKPPLPLLRLAKDFAKASDHGNEALLPSEIATVLYFACLAAARVRLRIQISELDDEALLKGIRWCASQQWLDSDTRTLFDETIATFS